MQMFSLITLLFLSCIVYSQQSPYDGIYGYGNDGDEEAIGVVYIHSNSDSTALFYLDLLTGPPRYRMGSMTGQIKFNNDRSTEFEMSFDDEERKCKIYFQFYSDSLVLESAVGKDYCGFGYGVSASGTYTKRDNQKPLYFVNPEGEEVRFEDLNWREH